MTWRLAQPTDAAKVIPGKTKADAIAEHGTPKPVDAAILKGEQRMTSALNRAINETIFERSV